MPVSSDLGNSKTVAVYHIRRMYSGAGWHDN